MKRKYKKSICISIAFILMFALLKIDKANAYVNTSNNWGFGIVSVINADRLYYDDHLYWKSGSEVYDGNDNIYFMNSKEVLIVTDFITQYFSSSYVTVDGVYIGNSNDTGVFFDFNQIGNNYYNTIIIKNLTPGKHNIEVKADRPFNISGGDPQKKDSVCVYIPVIDDEYILQSIQKIKTGSAKVSDYIFIGTEKVTKYNLATVNEKIKGMDINSSNVQDVVNEILVEIHKSESVNNINNGVATFADYSALGIKGLTSYTFKIINESIKIARSEKNQDLTEEEIELLAKEVLNKLDQVNERINNGQGTLDDYIFIGATGVTNTNLVDVNSYVKGKDNSTVSKMQANINLIVDAFDSINNGVATLNAYKIVGIDEVTSSNLASINRATKVARDEKKSDLSKEEIELVIKQLPNKLEQANARINNGEGTLTDYTLVGITGITDMNVVDVNWYVKGKDNSTVSKLQINANIIVTALININNGTTTIGYYTSIGIITVDVNNVKPISVAIKNAKTIKGNNLTKEEIIKVIDDTLKDVNSSKARINNGEGTLDDYTLVGITGVTDINLVDVNWSVKGKDNGTISKLQNNVNIIVTALTNVNSGTTVLSYYTTLGITSVDINNVKPISIAIKSVKDKKENNLTRAEIMKVIEDTSKDVNGSKAKINDGQGTLDDYTLVGITGVTDLNLVDVNWYVNGKDNSTISKLQSNVNIIVTALTNVNSGLTTVSYYTTLDITTVDANNIKPISIAVKNAKIVKGNNLTRTEIIEIVKNTAKDVDGSKARINNGEGTVDDYALVGITGVIEANLVDVNWYVNGKDNSTVSKLQTNVNTIVNALTNINNGTTTVSYYTTLKIMSVNTSNIKTISASVKNAKIEKGSNLTKAEIERVVENTLNSKAEASSLIAVKPDEKINSIELNKDILEKQADNTNINIEDNSSDIEEVVKNKIDEENNITKITEKEIENEVDIITTDNK